MNKNILVIGVLCCSCLFVACQTKTNNTNTIKEPILEDNSIENEIETNQDTYYTEPVISATDDFSIYENKIEDTYDKKADEQKLVDDANSLLKEVSSETSDLNDIGQSNDFGNLDTSELSNINIEVN